MANAAPHFSAKTHSEEPRPIQLPSAVSNNCTKVMPTSCRTHSSKIAHRKVPYCSASTLHSVTTELDCWRGNGGSASERPEAFDSPIAARSTSGMNCKYWLPMDL